MLSVEKNVSLKKLNTLNFESTAEYFCSVSSKNELSEALTWAQEKNLPIIVLGKGSNVLFAANMQGLVVHIAIMGIELFSQNEENLVVSVGAGEDWHQLVLKTLKMGWFGLENLSLIPGSVGAAPIQNIGAYGIELSDRFDSLEVVDKTTGQYKKMSIEDCQFGYRDSLFKRAGQDKYIIVSVNLRLSLKPNISIEYPALKNSLLRLHTQLQMKHGQSFEECLTPKMISDIVCSIRRSKLPDPLKIPNIGSFFKNPIVTSENLLSLRKLYPDIVSYNFCDENMKISAGYLIEKAGWKGYEKDGVGVDHRQALVLVNLGGSAEDILSLAHEIQTSIFEKFSIQLEIEPRIYR
jgi:UDP-N-acetylmuramate dehydrogenase